MDFYKGEKRLLYIDISGEFLPIGCLISDAFNEESEFIPTTTRDNGGWETSRPTNQRFTVDFSGLVINTAFAGGDFTKVSYDTLINIKRSRELKNWKLSTLDGQFVHLFQAYIETIGDAADQGDMLSFNATLIGFGKPEFTSEKLILLSSGNENEYIQDGNTNIINP